MHNWIEQDKIDGKWICTECGTTSVWGKPLDDAPLIISEWFDEYYGRVPRPGFIHGATQTLTWMSCEEFQLRQMLLS